MGILAMVDGRGLLDPPGHLRLADLRAEIDRRTVGVPALRRIVFRPRPRPLAGRPLWIDDPAFRVERHVGEVGLPLPGDEAALLTLVEQLMAQRLDRSRPLWRMWFVTGSDDGRIGVLFAVHHALADGLTAMRMVRSLLEPPMPQDARAPRRAASAARPPPRDVLVRDNLRPIIDSILRLARPATWRQLLAVARFGWRAYALGRHAPRSSLNAPVGPRRRLATQRFELATAKHVARTYGCGVNDVVLSLVAGGVRALLDARGEPVQHLRPQAGIAVALFSPGHQLEAGNDIGTLHVPLPLGEPDPAARLTLIAAERTRATADPMVAAEPVLRAWLGRFGGFRRSLDQQRLVNLAETYLPGPPVRIEVLGAPVFDLIPIAPLAGNLGLSFVALSYAGRIAVTVRVDADQFPDLDVLLAAMERDWQALARSVELRPADRVTSPSGS
jgi:WS/DGAT/MGAT family acyltransferase